jgi:hypothetical protein
MSLAEAASWKLLVAPIFRVYATSCTLIAPSESSLTVKDGPVVAIDVGRHGDGHDTGVRRRRPFSIEGYHELRLDRVLGRSAKGGGAHRAASACLQRRDSGAYPAGMAREVHEPTDERRA